MKIKLTRPLRGDEGTRGTGAIVTRPDPVARKLIDRGLATELSDEEAEADSAAEPASEDGAEGAEPTTAPPAPKPKRKSTRKGAAASKGE